MEVGAGQSRQVAELFTEQDFELVRIIKDYADTERHVFSEEGVDCERYEAGETHRHVSG